MEHLHLSAETKQDKNCGWVSLIVRTWTGSERYQM